MTHVSLSDLFQKPASGAQVMTVTINVLYNFGGAENPEGPLYFDAAGDIFVETDPSSSNLYGSIVELENTTYAGTTLVKFDGADGDTPVGGVIMDAQGNLIGATIAGGIDDPVEDGNGTVFEIQNPTSTTPTITTLVNFSDSTVSAALGDHPLSGLISDAKGDLFGATSAGGPQGGGTVFEISDTGGVYGTAAAIASFSGNGNTTGPIGNLTMDVAGDLFGTTYGANGIGTVFEIVDSGGVYASSPTTLAAFTATDGQYLHAV
jgi:hypothetical protein